MGDVHVTTESKQDYVTPRKLIGIIAHLFGVSFEIDLAADVENARCDRFFSKEDNSLSKCWEPELQGGVGWLNPPFRGIDPWMGKCKKESENNVNQQGARIISLTLASLGTRWYQDHVEGNALSLILRDRVTFEGQKDPFPKELMISLWGFGMSGLGFWRWK